MEIYAPDGGKGGTAPPSTYPWEKPNALGPRLPTDPGDPVCCCLDVAGVLFLLEWSPLKAGWTTAFFPGGADPAWGGAQLTLPAPAGAASARTTCVSLG